MFGGNLKMEIVALSIQDKNSEKKPKTQSKNWDVGSWLLFGNFQADVLEYPVVDHIDKMFGRLIKYLFFLFCWGTIYAQSYLSQYKNFLLPPEEEEKEGL